MKVYLYELVNGRTVLGKSSKNAEPVKDLITLSISPINGQMNLGPYAPFAENELELTFNSEHVITSYEVGDKNILAAYEKAWEEYTTKKKERQTGIKLPPKKKLDII